MMASDLVLKETEAQVQQTDQLGIAKLEEAMKDEPEKVASDVDMIDNLVARALESASASSPSSCPDLQQKYTDEDRRVQDKKAQITELRAKVNEQPPRIVGTERYQLPTRCARTSSRSCCARQPRRPEAKRGSVTGHLADFNQRLSDMTQKGWPQQLDDDVQQARAACRRRCSAARKPASLDMSEDKL